MLKRTIGTAGEHQRHARTNNDANTLRVGQVLELLPETRSGQNVTRDEVRHHEDVGLAATDDTIPFVRAASAEIALSNASGPSTIPPRI